MRKYRYGLWAVCLSSLVTLSSCFNLDEDPYSEVLEESYVPTPEDEIAFLATTYAPLRFIMDWYGYFDLQEESGDVIVTPTRPTGWDDGGVYKKMHMHTWTNQQGQPQTTWSNCYNGINNVNKILLKAEQGFFPEGRKDVLVPEIRAVRALWYSILCDTHGNVPISVSFTDELPKQSTRKEVFDFVINEINEVLPLLPTEVNKSTYGRMTQWSARCLLARMYLNAEVYTGTPAWDKALEQCNKIIESGLFSLESVYSDIFKTNNDKCVETIFAVPYDAVYNSGDDNGPVFGMHMKWLSTDSRKVYNLQTSPWNGSGANPQFINSYDPDDQRLYDTWLQGPQKNFAGEVIFEYVNKLPSLYKSDTFDGYRVGKYEIEEGAKSALSNDFPYFRYTEVLLMKAECLLRLGQNEQEAANLVTQIRQRAFPNHPEKAKVTVEWLKGDTHIQYGILDEDGNIVDKGDQTPVQFGGLYDEWSWEFACEARRRIDMIRFGTFQTKSWFNHKPVGDHATLFPIHLDDLQTNPNLKQNPGYGN